MALKTQQLKKHFWRTALAVAFSLFIFVTQMSPAGFAPQDLRTRVEIDGINYGSFDKVGGLTMPLIDKNFKNSEESFKKISFKRDFVTDPSLYLWAKNVSHNRSILKDVNVVLENRSGEEVTRYVLKYCQPLSWTVEAANPAMGGYQETVEMAVQDIEIF